MVDKYLCKHWRKDYHDYTKKIANGCLVHNEAYNKLRIKDHSN